VTVFGDSRLAAEIGRRARLELWFARRGGRTVLADAYAEPPFRVGRCFPEAGGALHLIMASSAPGVFGGDVLDQIVHVGPDASVRLTSQSSVQAHPAPDGSVARLRSTYHVAAGGELSCHWHPLIPFAGAEVDQRLELRVADGGRLEWSDALMSGRVERGERWAFASLAHELGLWLGDTLAYLERYRLDGGHPSPGRPWIDAGCSYFGTTLLAGPGLDPAVAERIHAALSQIDGVRGAADAIDDRLALVRLMASEGIPFHRARRLATAVMHS
jgi:urease accessory protein